jgi:hypothetical protein
VSIQILIHHCMEWDVPLLHWWHFWLLSHSIQREPYSILLQNWAPLHHCHSVLILSVLWQRAQFSFVFRYLCLVLTCIQSAIKYLQCISDLNVGVKIKNVGDCFFLWAFMYWLPMGLFGRTINGYTVLTDPSRKYHKVLFWSLSPLSSWMYIEFVDMFIHNLSWSMMHYDWMNVLQICTWATFPEHCYSPRMDWSPLSILHSCGTKKCMQSCLTFLLIVESLCLVCYVELYHQGSNNLSIFVAPCLQCQC